MWAARRVRWREARSTRVSRTEGRVVVKPAARRMWRIGGRRREGGRGFVDILFGFWLVVVVR